MKRDIMMDRTTAKQRTGVEINSTSDATTEVSKIGVITVAAFGTLVGLWSLACLFGGMMASGGPLAFVGSWFKAVSGM
jgi:hypothetical protein